MRSVPLSPQNREAALAAMGSQQERSRSASKFKAAGQLGFRPNVIARDPMALELINSAMESVIDLLHPGLHPEIKVIKDMVAGAVLIISVAALVVAGAMVFDSIGGIIG